MLVLGVQGFVLALIGESLGRIQRDVEGRPLYTIEEELMSKRVLVTGGAGFISSNFIRHLLEATAARGRDARRAHLRRATSRTSPT